MLTCARCKADLPRSDTEARHGLWCPPGVASNRVFCATCSHEVDEVLARYIEGRIALKDYIQEACASAIAKMQQIVDAGVARASEPKSFVCPRGCATGAVSFGGSAEGSRCPKCRAVMVRDES